MANPNPQHTPTDGLGVAAYVQISGSTDGSVVGPVGTEQPGQGNGASASGSNPVAQYAVTLSVSSSGGYAQTLTATASLVDAQNNAYTPAYGDTFTAISYNNPSAGSPAWYKPSNFAGYSADVASAAMSGGDNNSTLTIAALNPGRATVEVAFATFDNTLGDTAQPPADQPVMKIYAQVLVTVIP